MQKTASLEATFALVTNVRSRRDNGINANVLDAEAQQCAELLKAALAVDLVEPTEAIARIEASANEMDAILSQLQGLQAQLRDGAPPPPVETVQARNEARRAYLAANLRFNELAKAQKLEEHISLSAPAHSTWDFESDFTLCYFHIFPNGISYFHMSDYAEPMSTVDGL